MNEHGEPAVAGALAERRVRQAEAARGLTLVGWLVGHGHDIVAEIRVNGKGNQNASLP
jgi:hypothetical protein